MVNADKFVYLDSMMTYNYFSDEWLFNNGHRGSLTQTSKDISAASNTN